jgi:hypothetical protein
MTDRAPLVKDIEADVDTVAAGADASTTIGRAPFAGIVTAVTYTPNAQLNGADTDTRTVSIINKGQDGNGTTSVASKAFTSGVNANDFDETPITLSGTAGHLDVAEGDILAFVSAHGGSTGLADPGGHVKVSINRS